MEMTEIRKETFGTPPEAKEAIRGLAESAKMLLGYNLLAKLVGTATQELDETEIHKGLRELEIDILNPSDVRHYQMERLVEETTVKMKAWLDSSQERMARSDFGRFMGPCWEFKKISEYAEPIPEFVLAKAVQIKERLPECEIYIESLEDHPDPFLFIGGKSKYNWMRPDEYYAIEVWAEPKFEGRL